MNRHEQQARAIIGDAIAVTTLCAHKVEPMEIGEFVRTIDNHPAVIAAFGVLLADTLELVAEYSGLPVDWWLQIVGAKAAER